MRDYFGIIVTMKLINLEQCGRLHTCLVLLLLWISTVLSEELTPCPDGWYYSNLRCYKLFLYKGNNFNDRSWVVADNICNSKDAHLVTFNTALETYAVERYLNRSGMDHMNMYWIGLRVLDGGEFWVDGGDTSKFNQWHSGLPPDWLTTEASDDGYGVADAHGSWFKVPNDWIVRIDGCDEPSGFVCERKATIADVFHQHYANQHLLHNQIQLHEDHQHKRLHSALHTLSDRGGERDHNALHQNSAHSASTVPSIEGKQAKADEHNWFSEKTGHHPMRDHSREQHPHSQHGHQYASLGLSSVRDTPLYQPDAGKNVARLNNEIENESDGWQTNHNVIYRTASVGEVATTEVSETANTDETQDSNDQHTEPSYVYEYDYASTDSIVSTEEPEVWQTTTESPAMESTEEEVTISPITLQNKAAGSDVLESAGDVSETVTSARDDDTTAAPTEANGSALGDMVSNSAPYQRKQVSSYDYPDTSNPGYHFVNVTVFCATHGDGIHAHPLHCWQFLVCGRFYGGPKEGYCYPGRRFEAKYPGCVPDKTCIYGARLLGLKKGN